MMKVMTDWKQQIEAQITSLKNEEAEARLYDDEDYGDLFKETYTMLQALLDVAVAAERCIPDVGYIDDHDLDAMAAALDKLREVGDD
jgi:hypothetical protein